MIDAPCWPSRQFVFAVVLATVITAAAVCVPDAVRIATNPAEAAYRKGWMPKSEGKWPLMIATGFDRSAAEQQFRKAFELKPKLLKYQLALIRALSNKPSALDALLKDKRLLPRARAMAEYHRAACGTRRMLERKSGDFTPAEAAELEAALRRLETAQKLDPGNATPCYEQARLLYALGRSPEAALAVHTGNRRLSFREYDYLDPVFRRTLGGMVSQGDMSDYIGLREVARSQVRYANLLIRRKDTRSAICLLEDVVALGKRQAAVEPKSVLGFLVGRAIFQIGYRSLDRLYEDFDQSKKHRRLGKMKGVFDFGVRRVSRYARQQLPALACGGSPALMTVTGFWVFVSYAGPFALMALLANAVFFLVELIRNRRRGEPRYVLPVWQPGQLARATIVRMVFLLLVAAGVWTLFPNLCVWLGASIILGLAAVHLSQIWAHKTAGRAYVAKEGPDAWPFSFRHRRKRVRMPAAHGLWLTKHVLFAEAANLAMFVWVALVLIVIYRLSLGGYPWEFGIFGAGALDAESRLVTEILSKMPR